MSHRIQEHRVCVRCIMDTTVPGIRFDETGECNFCSLHDKLDKEYPLGPGGARMLSEILAEVKAKGSGKKYDCVMGVSGGRDSTYLLYLAKKVWNLRPLAVHFNDGFSNPVAGENIQRTVRRLGVELRTITSDWRESKDIRLSFLRSSTPNLEVGTDLGIAAALYGTAARENTAYILIGQSFRTEGIAPLAWNYLDGKYLRSVHDRFGSMRLRQWRPGDPGYHLDIRHLAYYTFLKGIRTVTPLYYLPYVRDEADTVLRNELGWVNPGAHYYDDLYQSLITYIYRVKFNIDRRKTNYSALVRSGQMSREEALQRIKEIYIIEDPKVIELCVQRLGISRQQLEEWLALPPKTFRDYPTHYNVLRTFRLLIRILCNLQILPRVTYDKYFRCG